MPQLSAGGRVGFLDSTVLGRYATLLAESVKLAAWLKEQGETYERRSNRGGVTTRLRPEAGLLLRIEKQLLALEDRIGMNPLARARLGIPPQSETGSPAGRFFAPPRPGDAATAEGDRPGGATEDGASPDDTGDVGRGR
ncbi:MAG: P27 family phage terminase small subunit [Planctomycetes bacterium]|nr:P27 family phage terminase small subunit [Planctomycetota bacterium]